MLDMFSILIDHELKEKYQSWMKVGLEEASLKLSHFTVCRGSQRNEGMEM